MAAVVTIVGSIKLGSYLYEEFQKDKKIASQEEELVIDDPGADEEHPVVASGPDSVFSKPNEEEPEDEVPEEMPEKPSFPAEELVKHGNFNLPLKFPGGLQVQDKIIIRDELHKIVSTVVSPIEEMTFESLDPAREDFLSRLHSFSPSFEAGTSTHQEDGEVPRISISEELGHKLLSVSGVVGSSEFRDLEGFWNELRDVVVGDNDVFEVPPFAQVAMAGFRCSYYSEGDLVLVSREASSTNPMKNGGIWPAHLTDGIENKELGQFIASLESKSYERPDLFDFEKVTVRFPGWSKKGLLVSLDGARFLNVDGQWRLFFESEEASRQIVKYTLEEEKFWVIFPDGRKNNLADFTTKSVSWNDFKGFLGDESKFRKREFFGVPHFIASEEFEKQLSTSAKMWTEAMDLTRAMSGGLAGHFEIEGEYTRRFFYFNGKKDGSLVARVGSVNDMRATEKSREIKEGGKEFKLEKMDFLSPKTVSVIGLERWNSVGNYPIGKITWRKTKLVPGESKTGGCNIVWVGDHWKVVLPPNKFYDEEAVLNSKIVDKFIDDPEEKPKLPNKVPDKSSRKWTAVGGKTLMGEFVEFVDDDKVKLRVNGRLFTLKLSQLSEADREFLGR